VTLIAREHQAFADVKLVEETIGNPHKIYLYVKELMLTNHRWKL